MKIPNLILRQLYTFGSLVALANRRALLAEEPAERRDVDRGEGRVAIDDQDVDLARLTLDGRRPSRQGVRHLRPRAARVSAEEDHRGRRCPAWPLTAGRHKISIAFNAEPFGDLTLSVEDSLASDAPPAGDAALRQGGRTRRRTSSRRARRSCRRRPGVDLHHVGHYSIDPHTTQGQRRELHRAWRRCRSGFAGPLRVNGEHAQGEFFIPMATTEGTLVASYNRGMKVLNLSGGVTCTVVDDCMQRAPVFVFDSAREARDFRDWVNAAPGRDHARGRVDVQRGEAAVHRHVPGEQVRLPALQLLDRRRRGAEHGGPGDVRGLHVDPRADRHGAEVLPRVELRHRQEGVADQHHAHARQARHGRGHRAARRCSSTSCASSPRA